MMLLLTILTVIFLTIYVVRSRRKRHLQGNINKQEPRFIITTNGASEIQENYLFQSENESEIIVSQKNTTGENILFENNFLTESKTNQQTEPAQPQVKSTSTKNTSARLLSEEIIYLILLAKADQPYVGYELLQALLATGLRYGPMNIFHRYEDIKGQGKILFSMASASEPGSFEISKIGGYSGRGLMMFLRFSTTKDVMQAFDIMLETARQLVEDLGGEILDDEHRPLTSEKIAILKKKILTFEQKQHIPDLFEQ
jgi:cell division protein ZipA